MKSILVMDVIMTGDGKHICDKCPIWNETLHICQYDLRTGHKGCPLRPMPEKKPVSYHDDLFGDIEKNYTNIGWNDCIDVLEGKWLI